MMPDSDFFCLCNFPKLPEDIKQLVIDSASRGIKGGAELQFLTRSSVTPDQRKAFNSSKTFTMNNTVYSRAWYRRYEVDQKVIDWVHNNISENCGQIGSQIIYNGDSFSPHTDGGPREYILNFNIIPGGNEVQTLWFKDPDHPLVREGDPVQYPDPSHLELVKSTSVPTNEWCLLYGKIVHAVSGVTDQRIHLSIALSKEEFKRLKERYNLDLKYYG
jgi:hypothetical protein